MTEGQYLVLCTTDGWGGLLKDNYIPWQSPDALRFFDTLTKSRRAGEDPVVVYFRSVWEAQPPGGKALPGRNTIIFDPSGDEEWCKAVSREYFCHHTDGRTIKATTSLASIEKFVDSLENPRLFMIPDAEHFIPLCEDEEFGGVIHINVGFNHACTQHIPELLQEDLWSDFVLFRGDGVVGKLLI